MGEWEGISAEALSAALRSRIEDTQQPDSSSVVVYKSAPSFEHFFLHHLVPNVRCWSTLGIWSHFDQTPAIINGLTQDWRSTKEWICDGHCKVPERGSERICWSSLARLFGSLSVPVAVCNAACDYGEESRSTMKMSDYLAMNGRDDCHRVSDGCVHEPDRVCYLKDWHLLQSEPSYHPYRLPVFFADDWVNDFWDASRDAAGEGDDYRFVYIGVKGTFTALHADVFRSYSWSSNVCGKKRWHLFRPCDTPYLTSRHGELLTTLNNVDEEKYPEYRRAEPIIVIQETGQTIFVPRYSENMEDTISINHNWANASNIRYLLEFLMKEWDATQAELEGFGLKETTTGEEWHQQCVTVMRANAGLDFEMFTRMVLGAISKFTERLNVIRKECDSAAGNYCLFSLAEAYRMIDIIKSHGFLSEGFWEAEGNSNDSQG